MNLRLKKITLWLLSSLTRWLWRLIVFVTIFAAVLVSAGRELAPLLREHKTWLEARLTESTGETTTMEQVDAHWEGLVPELVVKKLTVGDVLQVDSVLMRVDLLASARSLALVFDALDVNRASVTIPVGSPSAEQAFDFQAGLDFLFGSADIRVRNLEIILQHNTKNQLSLQVDELTVKNTRHSHWLNGTISVGKTNPVDGPSPAQLVIKFDGDTSNIFAGRGRAYVDLGGEKNVALVWGFLHRLFDNQSMAGISGVDRAKGQLWASWESERIEWVSDISIKELVLTAPGKYTLGFSGQLAGHILMEDMLGREYFIQTTPDQQITINQRLHPLPVFALQYNNDSMPATDSLFAEGGDIESRLNIYLPEFHLATLNQYLDLLPSKQLRDTLKTLNPSGELKNVLLDWPLHPIAKHQPLFRANLEAVSVSAWQGAPALTSVDGYLEATADSGFVELDSRQGFSMHYKTLYRKAMEYARAQGRVYWQLQPDDRHIYVGSQSLDFYSDDGDLHGSFWLDIPADQRQSAQLYLAAGLINTQVKHRNKYLPYTLEASLSRWLASSLKNGDMSESGFIYRGPLEKSASHEQTLLFFSKVKNGRLQFDPAWPVLSDMDASVLVHNEEVYTTVKKARFLGFTLNQASADLKVSASQQGHFLSLRTNAHGSARDLLKVMRDTPLHKSFGNIFDGWRLGGDVSGRVNLGLRVGSAEETDYQELDLHFKDNDLLVGKIDLPLKHLSGDMHYSSVAGLSSTQLSADLWGQSQQISIVPVADDDGLPDMAVSMTGNIYPDALAKWTHLSFVHFLKGNIPVTGTLTVPLDTASVDGPDGTLSIQSEMKGVAIDLPVPFKKLAAASMPAMLNIELWKDKQIYRADYGGLMSALIEQNHEGKLKGDIFINQQDKPGEQTPDFLRIRANIEQTSLAEWLPVIDRHTAFVEADVLEYKKQLLAQDKQLPLTQSTYPVLDLLIKQLSIGSMKLDDMKLWIDYRYDKATEEHWNVAFENLMMAGNYRHYDDESRLPEADFDRVKIGEPDQTPEAADQVEEDESKRIDPLADVIPQELPALRVHAKQVILQGNDVGDWRYTLQPTQEGVVLNDFYVTMPGLAIQGAEKDRGATMHWYRSGDEIRTEVNSKINLGNEEGAKKLFGVDRIIEADKTEFFVAANWKGSPAMLSFRRMQGDVAFTAEKGLFLNRTASTDLMRVINVFNFTTWARRLQLDFTDLYKKGVSFDKVTARVRLDQGKVTFDKPLVMVGPSGRFELKGTVDSVQNLIDASLIVTIPVNNNAAWIAGLAAGLPVAAGVWVASKVFGDQIDKLSSINYSISGTLDKPTVKFVRLLPELSKSDKDNKLPDTKN